MEQIVWVPSGTLSPPLDGSLIDGLAEQVEGEVADDGHIFGSVSDAQTGLIFVESHLEDSMKIVFDAPMAGGRALQTQWR